ncbi:MAG TPA: hypothetical protein VGN05_09320 [Parvibaculum sp.]|jgi:ElaB/YqjD/DUF883 family membrane-anchored ribosome-binding protein
MAEKSAKAAEEKVGVELDELRAEIERLNKALADAKTMIAEEIGEGAETLRETASEFAEDMSDRAQEGWKELQKQIAENPVPSALIALAVGFVLARILTR